MFPSYCAYVALSVCLCGILWRVGRWFAVCVGPGSRGAAFFGRMVCGLTGAMQILFSRKIGVVLFALVTDVLFQRRILKQGLINWIMHMALFYGVLLLTGLHALDHLTLERLTDNYASTRNPYMLLRNLLGLFLFAGIAVALIRRHINPLLKRFNAPADKIALLLCTFILLSGVGLEAVRIISATTFNEMVADYLGSDDPRELNALKVYWAQHFDVVFQEPIAVDARAMELGRQIHADYCAVCHSRPTAAIMADPLAKAIKPLAAMIDRAHLDTWLWYLHFLAGCLALALLPFSKFFHLVSVPASLALRAMGGSAANRPLNRYTRRAIGLDACIHCGACSRHCSVAPIMAVVDNADILPSEKIGSVRRMALGRLAPGRLITLAHGGSICTSCGRCTDVCPAGIDLQDLWQASQGDLSDQGFLPLQRISRWFSTAQSVEAGVIPIPVDAIRVQTDIGLGLTENPATFWACVQCTTCTNVCPVVAASDNPRQDLDFTPQQVMNLMRLGFKQEALGCGMVWKCVTCYKCQEHCPHRVPVADVLYELRNQAWSRWVQAEPIQSAER